MCFAFGVASVIAVTWVILRLTCVCFEGDGCGVCGFVLSEVLGFRWFGWFCLLECYYNLRVFFG